MAQASRRIDFTGPALVRLLASLTQADVPGSRQAFAERLSQWVGWTDAIALSAALGHAGADGAVPAPATSATPATPATTTAPEAEDGGSVEEHDARRVRAALAKAMADDHAVWTAEPGSHVAATAARLHQRPPPMTTDFAPYRWRYLARQQAMDSSIAPLRERLRQSLSARGPALARLAAVDAAMERALGAQERTLLATVPVLLERCFVHQRQAAQAADTADTADTAAAGNGWLQQFQHDMHGLLLAELDLRLLPIEGLLAALHQPLAAGPTQPLAAASMQPLAPASTQPLAPAPAVQQLSA